MDDLRDRLIRGDLVQDVRALLQRGAEDHGKWLRENLRHALVVRKQDAVAISAMTGVAPGTVRGFLNGRPSSIHNVLLMVEAIGLTIAELDLPPEEFRERVVERRNSAGGPDGPDGGNGGAIGASLLAFDESPTPMAILLLDGTILKVNRQLRELLGYAEGELVGAAGRDFSVRSEDERADRSEELAATNAVQARVTQLRHKDGSLISAVTSALVVRDADGEPRYLIARAAPTSAASA